MNDDGLPEHPRLRKGCCIFEDGDALVLRSSQGAFRIEATHRQAMLRVFAKLDGMRDFTALLGGERAEDAFYALHMLDLFAHFGLLAEGPSGVPGLRPPIDAQAARLDGITLTVVEGLVSNALSSRLEGFGAAVRYGTGALSKTEDSILLVCPDGPDLKRLEETNCATLKAGAAWLPVLPFGDAIVVGPLIRPGSSPCFRCFELRWLGISPSIALERAYFAHLRQGAWRQEALTTPDEAEHFADQVASTAARYLASLESQDRVALIRPGTVSEAVLERHPYCSVCAYPSGAGRESRRGQDSASWWEPPLALAELHQSIAAIANSFCGLASIVPPPKNGAKLRACDSPEVVVARFAMPEPDNVDGDQDNFCHGSAARGEDALTVAIVEALERYSGLSPASPGISASYVSIAGQAILPTELPLFSQAQYARPGFPFHPFDPQRTMRWTWGYNLTREKPILVPATAAWYGEDDGLLGETSSGVAAHSSRGHALLNGTLEMVERDAFMIHWLNRLSPPLIDLSGLDDAPSAALIRCVEKSGYAVRVADLTTDLDIPVCLAIGFREDCEKPALLVGAGASLDRATALSRSLHELSSAVLNATDLWMSKPPLQPKDVLRLEDHCRAYEHPEWLPHASFLWASSRRVTLRTDQSSRDPLEDLVTLTALLDKHGYDLIGVDITGPDVAKHRLRVVRAIVPGLQPLGFADRVRLGGRRLYEAPVRMGYREVPLREEALNTIPHCFP